MDMSSIGALSGVMGALVGGSASIATAWLTQRSQSLRELVRDEVQKREALYGEFVGECARLLMDAFTHRLERPETLLQAYALVNRIRLCASPPVLGEAERLMVRITDQYFDSNRTVDELRRIARSVEADPLRPFGEACRLELAAMRKLH
ncbi:MAG: hypothetical protein K0R70_782 [Steroidobacteraceae bacterium]|jgi:hypothetical protein|nr:hypothetical protein [Steroidobacteraceae bacterium]